MTLDRAAREKLVRALAASMIEHAEELTSLDQAIGDGDHGTNMDRGFAAIVAALDAGLPEADGELALAAARLRTVGRTLISTVGGAAGPLYGTAASNPSNRTALLAAPGTAAANAPPARRNAVP